jgi:hypothetical protein
VFSYQSIGGLAPGFLPNGNPSKSNLFFCATNKLRYSNSVDNIPYIQSIGNNLFNGGLNTEKELQ